MTREDEMIIESQKRYDDIAFLDGVKWADEHPKSKTIAEYLYKEKGYPISLNGDIPTYKEVMNRLQAYNNYKMRQRIEKACDGLGVTDAEPNLESLWHDASEEPKDRSHILIYYKYMGDMEFKSYHLNYQCDFKWSELVNIFEVECWAYISDLLPKQLRKSEQVKGE